MRKKKTKMGRPRKPLATKCSRHFNVHVTRAEAVMLEGEAKRRGLSISALLMSPWREKMAKESRQDASGLTRRPQLD